MKKSDLKAIIKECIREELFEGGILSNIIKEVLVGVNLSSTAVPIVEDKQPKQQISRGKEKKEVISKQINATKRKVLEAIGKDAYNGVDIFEGTTPLSKGGDPSNQHVDKGPLKDVDPNDPGVDLGIFGFNK